MVDFKTLLKEPGIEKPIDPFEIWEKLDKKIGKEYLRPTQIPIGKEWHENKRNKRDNIIKLHTGHGKTVLGFILNTIHAFFTSKLQFKSQREHTFTFSPVKNS